MDLRTVAFAGLVAAALYGSWQRWEARAVHPPDGPLAPAEPLQSDLPDTPPLRHGRWLLRPRAHYEITARVLAREPYHFDLLSDLVPEDLALGWGPMSDNRVLNAFEISQAARFYSWRPRAALPIAREQVISHSANTHVIPADTQVAAQLARLRVGQVAQLSGILVDATRDDGAWVRTSLTRSDSGAGACELMLVERVAVH